MKSCTAEVRSLQRVVGLEKYMQNVAKRNVYNSVVRPAGVSQDHEESSLNFHLVLLRAICVLSIDEATTTFGVGV